MSAIIMEAASISALGVLAGFGIYGVIISGVSAVIRAQTGIVLDPLKFEPVLLWAPAALVALGAVAGVAPALKAYRTEVAEHLVPLS